ncbi:jg6101, partial [Pararge aegeria aegeria]
SWSGEIVAVMLISAADQHRSVSRHCCSAEGVVTGVTTGTRGLSPQAGGHKAA